MIPKITAKDKRLKKKCSDSLLVFCETGFPDLFDLEFSDEHIDLIKDFEMVILSGGWKAIAMPRGSGKTTIAAIALLWAILTGRRKFAVLICANLIAAKNILAMVKSLIETNEILSRLYPEAVFPIQKLEGIGQSANGQTQNGERTRIKITSDRIVFPTIKGSKLSGCVFGVAGITGSGIRGQFHTTAEGKNIRPDIVLLDDLQTEESARSFDQCTNLLRIVEGAIKGMKGPGKNIAMLQTGTVIECDDYLDQILDNKKNPKWNGRRVSMLDPMPSNMDAWHKYDVVRRQSLLEHKNYSLANKYYKQNRDQLDTGAKAYWDCITEDHEVSAIQHAMNLFLDDQVSFYSDAQNKPLNLNFSDTKISEKDIFSKLNGYDKMFIPTSCEKLTMFIDVHKRVLYYAICAWEPGSFTGYLIDYGTCPNQTAEIFKAQETKNTLGKMFSGMELESYIYAGLEYLYGKYVGATYHRADGIEKHIDLCMVDAGWRATSDIVYEFCNSHGRSRSMIGSEGEYVGAKHRPYSERSFQKNKGTYVGNNFVIRQGKIKSGQMIRRVKFDANYWKSFFATRLKSSRQALGNFSFYGIEQFRHRFLASHILAERPKLIEYASRRVDEWENKPGAENHWLDCLVGCCVAASVVGVSAPGIKT